MPPYVFHTLYNSALCLLIHIGFMALAGGNRLKNARLFSAGYCAFSVENAASRSKKLSPSERSEDESFCASWYHLNLFILKQRMNLMQYGKYLCLYRLAVTGKPVVA